MSKKMNNSAGLPKVSIVMPVYNEESSIEEVLDKVLAQDYPSDLMEVLVVDGCSTDRTAELVAQYAEKDKRIRLLENKAMIVSSGRNVGIRASKSDWIFIIDGHSFVAPNYVSLAVNLALENEALCLARPQPLYVPEDGYIPRSIAVARESRLGGSVTTHRNSDFEGFVDPTSVAVIYHRSLFERFGLFDERFETNEDVEFNWRLKCAGIEAFFSGRLQCTYYPRRSLFGLRKQMFRYGFYRMQFLKKHPEAFHWSYMVPVLLLLSQLVLVVAELWDNYIPRQILTCELAVYGLAVLASSAAEALRRGIHYFPVLPFAYVIIHCGVGGGFVWGLLMPLLPPVNKDIHPAAVRPLIEDAS